MSPQRKKKQAENSPLPSSPGPVQVPMYVSVFDESFVVDLRLHRLFLAEVVMGAIHLSGSGLPSGVTN